MRKTLLRVGLTLFLACLLVLITAPYWTLAVGIPNELKVFPGMELSLDLKPPLRVLDQSGLEVTGFFDTENLGSNIYRVNLFGWLPLTEVVVDVVPLVRVFPGGQSIGVLLSSEGLVVAEVGVVVDREGVEHYPARDAGIQPGDLLLSIDGYSVRRPEQISQLVNSLAQEKDVLNLTLRRNNQVLTVKVKPVVANPSQLGSTYLLGIYLEDPAAGVGTLSFYDEGTGRFGALGHMITDSRGRALAISCGSIVEAEIDGIRYGNSGSPGEKVGFFHSDQDVMGIIDSNTGFGIFGQLKAAISPNAFARPVPVAFAHQVRLGPAEIYTVLQGNKIESFEIEIIKVMSQTKPSEKGMIIEVTDERLLREAGGIIQGMSGSPILQNGMLVGAITHVFVNNPVKGYGSFAEWMVYEAGLGKEEEIPAKQSFSREGFFLQVEKDFMTVVLKKSICNEVTKL